MVERASVWSLSERARPCRQASAMFLGSVEEGEGRAGGCLCVHDLTGLWALTRRCAGCGSGFVGICGRAEGEGGFCGFSDRDLSKQKKDKRMTGVDEDFLGGEELLKSEREVVEVSGGADQGCDVCIYLDREERRRHCWGSLQL